MIIMLLKDLVEARPSKTKMITPMQEFNTWWKIGMGKHKQGQNYLETWVEVREGHVGEPDVGEGGEGPGEAEVDDHADHPVAHAAHLL